MSDDDKGNAVQTEVSPRRRFLGRALALGGTAITAAGTYVTGRKEGQTRTGEALYVDPKDNLDGKALSPQDMETADASYMTGMGIIGAGAVLAQPLNRRDFSIAVPVCVGIPTAVGFVGTSVGTSDAVKAKSSQLRRQSANAGKATPSSSFTSREGERASGEPTSQPTRK